MPLISSAASPGSGDIPASTVPGLVGFTLGEALGEGGFAKVWAAEREEDGAAAAIKIGHARGAVLIERFRREASALSQIGPPYVAGLYRSGQLDDGRPYIAMERLLGRTLAEELKDFREPPSAAWAVRRADAILEALSAAHAHGITHRDLKPANIFITQPEGRVVLLDFGLSHGEAVSPCVDDALTRPGVVVGTPAYMAPEQIRCDPKIDERADLYAFGVVLFELLTLRTPFIGEARAIEHSHLALRPPRPSELTPVPVELDELTLGCLAKDPARRPNRIAGLRRALVEACATPSQPPPSSAVISSAVISSAVISSAGSGRLVAESGHPAVVLVVETAGAAPLVVAAVTGRGGLVVRRRGHRYVSVFPAGETEDSPQAALSAARDLVERHGARAALHLGSITLRYREQGPPAVYGASVDRPEGWLPGEPWSGLHCTAEMEQVLGDPASTDGASEVAPEEAPPLVGRDDLRAALAASAAAAFDGTCPGLFTLLGENGLGKTRLAAAAADMAKRAAAEAQVISLKAAPHASEAGVALETAAQLSWVLENTLPPQRDLVRTLAEALRRKARERPVAVILDDAHRADDALLDALELATLDGAGVRLWVVVIAHPRMEAQRPMWGTRTERADWVTLSPLDESAGETLAAWLLRPADYLPMETLRRLANFTGGNPAFLADLVRSLQRAGAVRQRPSGRGYDVASEVLAALPASPSRQWLAARRLAELPSVLAALARICAVLSPAFTEEELAAVLEGLDRTGGAGSPLDAGVGLSALSAKEIVAPAAGDRWAIPSAVLREAIEALVDPAHRAQIHRQSLLYWRARAAGGGREAESLEAVARHAAGCGERAEAAGALLSLGEAALSRHRYLDADLRFSAALGLVVSEQDAELRARALAGRGRARYRIHRVREAREDFAAALSLAEGLGERRQQAELLLEDATALDWDRQFEASARRAEEARPIIEALGDPRLALGLRVAEGRAFHRRRETDASIARLSEASAEASALGELEPLVVALLLLSFELAVAGRLSEAEQRFDEVIALAEATGDLFHLGAAYINRVTLWMARGLTDRAIDDLHRAVALAREIGHPWIEHAAAYNVALMLYWSDAQVEALALARRACLLADRVVEAPIPAARLLLAEILLLLEHYEDAARLVEVMRASDKPLDPNTLPAQQMVRLVLSELGIAITARPEAGWEEVMRLAEEHHLHIEGMLKLLYWRARMALVGGRLSEASAALDSARSRRGGCAMWLGRFEALEAQFATTTGALS